MAPYQSDKGAKKKPAPVRAPNDNLIKGRPGTAKATPPASKGGRQPYKPVAKGSSVTANDYGKRAGTPKTTQSSTAQKAAAAQHLARLPQRNTPGYNSAGVRRQSTPASKKSNWNGVYADETFGQDRRPSRGAGGGSPGGPVGNQDSRPSWNDTNWNDPGLVFNDPGIQGYPPGPWGTALNNPGMIGDYDPGIVLNDPGMMNAQGFRGNSNSAMNNPMSNPQAQAIMRLLQSWRT